MFDVYSEDVSLGKSRDETSESTGLENGIYDRFLTSRRIEKLMKF